MIRSTLFPLTRTGWLVAAIGLVALFVTAAFGWVEVAIIATGCIIALLVALPFVLGVTEFTIERSIEPDRVALGDDASASLTVTNGGRAPTLRKRIEETVDGKPRHVEVPILRPGTEWRTTYSLPTERRGVFPVGPAFVAKSDPLGLMRREIGHSGTDMLWVHPRTVHLPALPAGFAKDLEGPTFDTSPAGDVAFHAVREYVPGDDVRHVHWMSTARAGALMVRQYVDNRLANVTVVIDNVAGVYTDDAGFETALQVGGSVGVSSMADGRPIALRIGDWSAVGAGRPATRDELLDRLAFVNLRDTGSLIDDANNAIREEAGTSVLVLVTGPVPPESILPTVTRARRDAVVVVVRVWPEESEVQAATIPGAKTLDVRSLDEFQLAWEQIAR